MKTLYLYIVGISILTACSPDSDLSMEELNGTWEVVAAERNGKPTETVVGAMFDFRADGTLRTDILNGRIMDGPYTISESSILHKFGNTDEMEYHVSWSEDGTLELKTQIQGFGFRFELQKKQAE